MFERILARIGSFYFQLKSYEYLNFILLFALMASFKYFDSFGIEDAADRTVATAATSVLGPVYGGSERLGQKSITIAGIDRAVLDQLGQDGVPLAYAKQAEILARIAEAKPAAIFLALYYIRARAKDREQENYLIAAPGAMEPEYDPGLIQLTDEIRRIEADMPVFIGPIGNSPLLAPLTKVGTHVALDAPADSPNEYFGVVTRELTSDDASDAPPAWAEPWHSAAVSIFLELCHSGVLDESLCQTSEEYFADDMRFFVRWGFGVSEQRASLLREEARERCHVKSFAFFKTFELLYRSAFRRAFTYDDRNLGEQCSYHDRVNLAAFLEDWAELQASDDSSPAPYGKSSDAALEDTPEVVAARIRIEAQEALIRARVVMIGVDAYELGDRVDAPLYVNLPGVAFHAMALDNLIEADGRVPRIPSLSLGFSFADIMQIGFSLTISILVFSMRRQTQSRLASGRSSLSNTATGLMLFFGVSGSIFMAGVSWYFQWSIPMMLTNIIAPAAVTAVVLVFLAQPAPPNYGG